jgi:hypothetical protein
MCLLTSSHLRLQAQLAQLRDPSYSPPQPPTDAATASRFFKDMLTQYITAEMGEDKALLAKVGLAVPARACYSAPPTRSRRVA